MRYSQFAFPIAQNSSHKDQVPKSIQAETKLVQQEKLAKKSA
jgi:hypothetical protein